MPHASVIYFIPRGTRLNPRRLAALLGEISRHAENPDVELLVANQNVMDARIIDYMNELAAEHPGLHVPVTQPGLEGGAVLAMAVDAARSERIIFIDGRAYLKPGAVQLLLQEAARSPGDAVGYALPGQGMRDHAADHSGSGALDRLFRLMRRPAHPVCAVWGKELHAHLGGFDTTLQFHAMSDFLLRAAMRSRLHRLGQALEKATTLTDASIRAAGQDSTVVLQQLLDEESRIVNRAMRDFIAGKAGGPDFSTPVLAREFTTRAGSTAAMIRALQKGQECGAEDLAHAFFVHGLLGMRLGQIDNSRDILETAHLIIREQPDLTRLYKLLLLEHRIESAPSPEDVARVEGGRSGPKVTVATPLFNQGRYLDEAVRSVVAQTYPDWEMVIVNDGSTDDSYEQARAILAAIDDPRIKLVSQENSGLGATRNRAIRESDGSYVVCLDADDMIAPDYFAIALDMLHKAPRAGWVNVKTLVFGGSHHVAWDEDFDFARCIVASASACTSMIRREALEEVGLFREDLTAREDWEVWLSLLDHGWTYVTTRHPLFFYRHAVKRPGMMPMSNVPSKEEVISLHPWWFRIDLDEDTRLKAFLEYTTVRFSPWFLNVANIERVLPVLHDREAFLREMACIKSEYPPVTRPKRWQNAPDDCYITTRKKKYGII
ncbi:glycosyltransferase family 2 protein [Oceanidesulfovibrio indonesiensis]|nr:glycosyltransferase [Oceanidesulfovibrio indonesiensis]